MTVPPGLHRRSRLLEVPLSLSTLALTWAGVETLWFPSWLYLGPLTFSTLSLVPVPLSGVVLAVAIFTYRRTGSVGVGRLLCAGLAGFAILGAVLAVVSLNRDPTGGVFFAGLPAIVFGVVLSVVVFINESAIVGRRIYGSVS